MVFIFSAAIWQDSNSSLTKLPWLKKRRRGNPSLTSACSQDVAHFFGDDSRCPPHWHCPCFAGAACPVYDPIQLAGALGFLALWLGPGARLDLLNTSPIQRAVSWPRSKGGHQRLDLRIWLPLVILGSHLVLLVRRKVKEKRKWGKHREAIRVTLGVSRWSTWSLDRSRMSFRQRGTVSGEVVLTCSCLQFLDYRDANCFNSEFLNSPTVSLIHLTSCFCGRNDSLRVTVLLQYLATNKAVCLQAVCQLINLTFFYFSSFFRYVYLVSELALNIFAHWTLALFFHGYDWNWKEYLSECEYLYCQPVGLMMALKRLHPHWSPIQKASSLILRRWHLFFSFQVYLRACANLLVHLLSWSWAVYCYIYQITGLIDGRVVHLENEILSLP